MNGHDEEGAAALGLRDHDGESIIAVMQDIRDTLRELVDLIRAIKLAGGRP